jgi:four helix bundle protein
MEFRSYQDLKVWQRAMDLAAHCYELTEKFPRSELFGLTNQIRRAAASVPANIAEGRARSHTKEFVQFLSVASGSVAELETHLLLAAKLKFLPDESLQRALMTTDEIGRMLTGLKKRLREPKR